jgi:hypothetical protein
MYYVCVLGIAMAIPVSTEEYGLLLCYQLYLKGNPIFNLKLVKIGDSYDDITYINVETYINKRIITQKHID